MIEKFSGFFNPADVQAPIHIIGCGAIGSTLAVQLTRCGLNNLTLWDFDKVASHNLANQAFRYRDITIPKTEAITEIIKSINPQATTNEMQGYTDEKLSGYVFMAVDKIDVRKQIVKSNMYNMEVKAMFDFRMRLKDAQHYAADWLNLADRKNLLETMNFTQEEADANTPVNACNMTMSIIPTVETVVSVGVANFINFIYNQQALKKFIMVNPFDY